jgi:uncharacterized protein YndB with AHSA1/START domain
MTKPKPTPDVPLRMEIAVEVPGTPEQVWDAIATGNGITSWFMPTDLEEREGGAILFHMGDDESPGTVTGWEPPHRFAIVEEEWSALTGHEDAAVTPLVSEFLVEAKSGGTCVLRVVSSAFGTGADWEQEFFDDMEKEWRPYFENLRLYLTHFPGQKVTPLMVSATVEGPLDAVWSAVRKDLGVEAVGQEVSARGMVGIVERLGVAPEISALLLRLSEPVPGFLGLSAHGPAEGPVITFIVGYFFSDDAAAYVEREEPAWKSWIEGFAVRVA